MCIYIYMYICIQIHTYANPVRHSSDTSSVVSRPPSLCCHSRRGRTQYSDYGRARERRRERMRDREPSTRGELFDQGSGFRVESLEFRF